MNFVRQEGLWNIVITRKHLLYKTMMRIMIRRLDNPFMHQTSGTNFSV